MPVCTPLQVKCYQEFLVAIIAIAKGTTKWSYTALCGLFSHQSHVFIFSSFHVRCCGCECLRAWSKSSMTSLSHRWKRIWSSSTAGATQSMASLTCGAIDTDIRHSSAGVHDTPTPADFTQLHTHCASWEEKHSLI